MDDKQARIKKAFSIIYDLKETARDNNRSASETMKDLVFELTADKNERKIMMKEMKVAYKHWVQKSQGDPSIEEGVKLGNEIL